MSLLGIDIGTTGCKSVIFSLRGEQLARSYRSYEIVSSKDGIAELNTDNVWTMVKETIKEVVSVVKSDPVVSLSVSSLGEAMVPVSNDRRILGNSILGADCRGEEFVELLLNNYRAEEVYEITGCYPGSFYSMPKIAWIKEYLPELYAHTDYFLSWADFVCFMLGGIPVTNYSHAGRTLLFNIRKCEWDQGFFNALNLDIQKFASPCPSGNFLGYVDKEIGKQLHLGEEVAIISGGHDQCCAALGGGVRTEEKTAMLGMGTFMCIVPVYDSLPDFSSMYINKLHIEHHVLPDSYISFIYNQAGGALLEWFRKTFLSIDQYSKKTVNPAYEEIFNEIEDTVSDLLVFPDFAASGPPDFLNGNHGIIHGLSLQHTRGDILKAMLEGVGFYFRNCLEVLNESLPKIELLVASGGGAASCKWLQVMANILNVSVVRNNITEAGALGAAIVAGVGHNIFCDYDSALEKMIHKLTVFAPKTQTQEVYDIKYKRYKELLKFKSL